LLILLKAISEPIFSDILNEVNDLKVLEIQDSSLYMKIAISSQLSAFSKDHGLA
jgi:hypothetical protein